MMPAASSVCLRSSPPESDEMLPLLKWAAIERAIRRKSDDKMPGKLALLDFDTVVDSGFDWSRIFEDMD